MKKLGIYVHIPYCRSKCPYCDFFSLVRADTAARYVDALCRAIEAKGREIGCQAETLYIGGGTPSVLEGAQIASITGAVRENFGDCLREVTVECNPSDTNEAFLAQIYRAGVNRLSFGMQSAVDSERRALGRRADAETVRAAIRLAQSVGFENISLDLMLGIPGQTAQALRESIDFCAATGIRHVSAYILKLEEDTYFYRHADKLDLPDDDTTADLYLQAVEQLAQCGFAQYEISNFAKPGYESRHNLKYWRLDPYLGFGAAAHSFFGGRRFYYPRDVEYFIAGGTPTDDGEGGTRAEQIMLGLRLREGIPAAFLSEKAKKELTYLRAQGLIEAAGERIHLTPPGFLISNSIIAVLTQEVE